MKNNSQLSILYIEDDLATARLTQICADPLKCKIDIVATGHEGIEEIKSKQYDAIVIDYHLPDMSCVDILKEVRLFSESLVIIILTTLITDEMRDEVLSHGADTCIEKDFNGNYIQELPLIIQKIGSAKGALGAF